MPRKAVASVRKRVRDLRSRPARGRPPRRRAHRGARSHDRRDDAPRPERPRHLRRPGDRARRRDASASSTSTAATSRSRTRTARSGPSRTASSTTTTRSARRPAGATATASASAATPRCSRTSTSATASAFARAAARQVRDRGLGRARAARGHRARPARDQAAVLRGRRRPACLRLRAEEPPLERPRRGRARLRGASTPTSRSGSSRRRGRPCAASRSCCPGHRLVIERARRAGGRTGAIRSPTPDRDRPVEDDADELLELLDESVRLRLMSDVPLGAMLSGGLDSSLIVALMARHMTRAGEDVLRRLRRGRGERTSSPTRGYVAEMFGTDHHELELSFDDAAVDLEDLVWIMDEPLADLSALGFLALSGLAAEHVTVALSGQGADELVRRLSQARGGCDRRPPAAPAGARCAALGASARAPWPAAARRGRSQTLPRSRPGRARSSR